ncbi:MAG: AMP-binding protein, partial [Oscillospiraceae bacterium]|nr:AMP-binding protein [Oscillospiraceae bacterium]
SNLLFYALAPDVEARVADPETGEKVPYGTVGELQIKRSTRSTSYINKPELNAASWTADGYFKTGDANIAVQLPDVMVLIAFCCRYLDNLIGKDGNRHWAFQVEAAVQAMSSVLDVLVAADPKNPQGFAVGAVPQEGISSEELTRQIMEAHRDSPYNIRVFVLDSTYDTSRTAISKRDRKGLIKLAHKI